MAHSTNGVFASVDYFEDGRIVKRETSRAGLPSGAGHDEDGDAIFERRVEFDVKGDPEL